MTAPVRLDPARVRRLLVVRGDNVGDVVLLTPALRALRAALPRARITLLASPAGAQLRTLLPWVDEVRAARMLWQDASGALPFDPARERALVDELAAGHFDAAVLSTSFSQSPHPAGYACYLAGIPVRAGFAADFAGAVLSPAVPPPPDGGHQADRALALVTALGVPPAGTHLELGLPPAAAHAARTLLAAAGVTGPYAVAAPGASCPSRRYDAERFRAVAAGLAAGSGLPVVVVGSERERALAEYVAADAPGVVPVAGRTSLPELAGAIAGAEVVVTNNSGPLHLADAFARPTVALFAGTERESEYAPRSAPLRLLRRPTTCSPCRAFTCPYHLECLDLPPGEVVAATLSLLPAHAAS
jgi:ADP-heptose:LPS heptosyltransferase